MFWFTLSAVLLLYALRYRYPYFIKEALFVFRLFSVGYRLSKRKTSKPYYTLVDRFLDSVKKNPNKAFIRFQDDTYTYLDSDKRSNKIAMTLLKHANLHEGDTVALLMGNEPMFLWIWLALAKIGCSAAFLNYNIRSKSLLHCFSCSGAGVLIAAAELQDAVEEVVPALREQGVLVYILTDNVNTEGMQSLTDKIRQASDESIPADLRANVTFSSPAVYIYTSGTTGLPKAALINHQKLWAMSFYQFLCGVTSDDLFYVNLPLYHSAGFCLGFLGSIERGATVVLRRKFSASQFWNDCRKYNVTVIQYIGETMRYLCNTPKRFSDQVHNVRIAFGNGLRADVWRTFISRFGQIDIKEFYGATEGNMSFMNFAGKIGAVGRMNTFHKKLNPYAFIKFDQEQEMPVRNADGFCQEVAKGETGLLVSKITQRSPFYGYARDPKQTQKKKLYNVFEKGDVYFNSGDLFRVDQENFIYFQDRVGDNFRWKGENVSTNEVSDMMTMSTSIDEANVYGVTVPGHEGRIGMAVIVLKEGQQFDCDGIFSHVTTYLPSYARPRFIRIQNCLAVTCTFKQLKVRLVEEGFNPAVINDPLFILDDTVKSYRPLTHEIYQSIHEGHFKL
ncbi:long-chain fatty acid transport protein 2-like [Myxocyprinus asiaticus]|uniref:long-chain fatty acid transport protein 2-like n=1 Tax=Myxocyprinus asiaticus TaxID=70543 RepID=UPI0022235EAB|nr:long-chain fatty acid transport protein 2-like [Myxocyprinus asiaticus]XP_051545347.1 long-chain fatty acid transport protein 2-like [Myxocyprinus asiaticus]XP_051545348.1 long-chain fatty acid transport protein 2-like [Myxocyprinus asiaticus]XP_051545349.1 long-chain fatty acid transport protein 2-like [Myxocyprinus asiaticus]